MPIGSVWTGLSDLMVEGTYVWISSGKEANYTNWGSNQPQPDDPNTGLDCALLDVGSWNWHMVPCETIRAYMCEISASQ